MVTDCFASAMQVAYGVTQEALPVTGLAKLDRSSVTGNGFIGTEMAYFHGAGAAFALSGRRTIR
ncbi:hypothetical protein [Azospirillum endophyticum]